MSLENRLHEALRKLKPTGSGGFEGLVSLLLAKLTGKRFYLARSGDQRGRDMSTAGEGANWIMVECKRYKDDTNLDERELLGELAEASLTPNLDVWVLVTSRSVPEQFLIKLAAVGNTRGIEVVTIGTLDTSPSSLGVLCAQGKDIIIRHLNEDGLVDEVPGVEEELTSIISHSYYSGLLQQLRNQFSSAYIGYENWRREQNNWLLNKFTREADSRAAFGQVLNINDEEVKLIVRESLWKELDKWFNSWNKEISTSFVVAGEEGDGKTWAVASWLNNQLRAENCPPCIFLTSQMVTSNDPGNLLITAAIAGQLKLDNRENWEEFWMRRLEGWMKRTGSSAPSIILIIDGLNEQPDFHWRKLMENLSVSPWKENLAIIFTCRTVTWHNRFSYLRHINKMVSQPWILPPYSDNELSTALEYHGLRLSDIPNNLLPIIRKPRYFDLVVKHRQSMVESGDMTLERLLYEDWRDRISRKSGYSQMNMSHQDFHAAMRDLAKPALSEIQSFTTNELADVIPYTAQKKEVLEELISSGVIVPDTNITGRYKVEPNRLVQGLGLLLAEEIRVNATKGDEAIEEAIASLLEPQIDMDIKARICGAAVLYAVMSESFSERTKFMLFQTWLNNRNLDEESLNDACAYLPLCPEVYVSLVEYFSMGNHQNHRVLEILRDGFIKYYDNEKVREALIPAIENWMGFIHPFGLRSTRGVGNKWAEKNNQRITGLLEHEPKLGPINFSGYNLTVVEDDGLIRLANFALSIISHKLRHPYVKAFVHWAVSREIMGYPDEYDHVEWILRTASDDIWKDLKGEIEILIAISTEVTLRAADRLLSCQGSDDAYQLREKLPKDLFPPHPALELYNEDPCKQELFLWSLKDYQNCLEREDVGTGHVARKMRDLSLDPKLPVPLDLSNRLKDLESSVSPDTVWKTMGMTVEDSYIEDIEPTLCAFATETFARIIRNIIRDAPNRDGIELRHLSLHLRENLIILESEERDAIYAAWRKLIDSGTELNEADEHSEQNLFRVVLDNSSPQQQLKYLVSRPENAFDECSFGIQFKVPGADFWDESIDSILKNDNNEKYLIRALWFFSRVAEHIPDEILDTITGYINHPKSLVRQLVLRIIVLSKNRDKIDEFVNSSWTCSSDNEEKENYWGSLLLCEYGGELTYDELRSRVYIPLIAYALKKRGLQIEEISKYAAELDTVWNGIIGRNGIPVDGDFPVGDIRSLMNPKSLDQSFIQVFTKIIEIKPELIEKWILGVYSSTQKARRMLHTCMSFYVLICEVLLDINPSKGIALFKRLQTGTDNIFPLSRFQNYTDNPDIVLLWKDIIEEYHTDYEILEIALLAQQNGRALWLNDIINEGMNSSIQYKQARAIVLLGFINDEEAVKKLQERLRLPESWLRAVAEYSLQNWKRNEWAKHWFSQYLTETDKVKAWASFKLFLKCADSRFSTWRQNVLNKLRPDDGSQKDRQLFLRLNEEKIRQSIEKNNKKFKEMFLGLKILRNQVWPWL